MPGSHFSGDNFKVNRGCCWSASINGIQAIQRAYVVNIFNDTLGKRLDCQWIYSITVAAFIMTFRIPYLLLYSL